MLSVARGLTQAFVSPLTGLLGDAWHRGRIIAAGTLIWASFSLAFGLCVNYSQARMGSHPGTAATQGPDAPTALHRTAGADIRGAVRRRPRACDAVRDGRRV